MGIIIREDQTGEIVFYMKGADIVMSSIVQYNDWLEEEVDNMAREGLRTLVVAKKSLTHDQYIDFEQKYNSAKLAVVNRSAQVSTNQVWSLTQIYSVDFLKSRIDVKKCVFKKCTIKVCVSCC